MTRPVARRALPPAFMVAAATALQEQKLKTACSSSNLGWPDRFGYLLGMIEAKVGAWAHKI